MCVVSVWRRKFKYLSTVFDVVCGTAPIETKIFIHSKVRDNNSDNNIKQRTKKVHGGDDKQYQSELYGHANFTH